MNALKINENECPLTRSGAVKQDRASFCDEVLAGLRSSPKYLQAKYFYDTIGDKIFQEIMNCEEYYPFNCELEIFSSQKEALAEYLMAPGGPLDLIELGPGDCTKTTHLLKHLVDVGAEFTYMPIDISSNIVNYLTEQLPFSIRGLKIQGLNGDYFDMLERAAMVSKNRKVVLFLGSNLGNMPPVEAEKFCQELRGHLNYGDLVLIGLDLKKDPHKILAAYNDKTGITKRFNLNLLERMNRELGTDFDLSKFDHFPVYDPETGSCKSYLISMEDQEVTLTNEGKKEYIRFAKEEVIFMEISQKYTEEQVRQLGEQASFEMISNFYDEQGYFLDTIWEAV